MRSVVARSRSGVKDADAYELVRALLIDRGPDDTVTMGAATRRLLDRCDDVRSARAWDTLAAEAEHHGVAPMIAPLIAQLARTRPAAVPEHMPFVFRALAGRHRHAAAAREACVDRLLEAFASARIEVVLLKGAALAHLIYREPALRPMADIDVLIDPVDAGRAIEVTERAGYVFAREYQSRFAGRMHHLPVASITHAGFDIALEIHVDAFSANQPGRLTLATAAARLRSFKRGTGPDGLTLDHIDMLRHLARHAFEPARRIRLIHLYDLWRYERVFRDEIDWQALAARFPEVMVVLGLVSYVFTAGSPTDRHAPRGVGEGMVPLSEIAAYAGLRAKLAALFNPPAWWMHGFYGVPPGQSLLISRMLWHPMTVIRWLAARLAAGIRTSALVQSFGHGDARIPEMKR